MRLIPAIVVLFSPIFAVALTVNTPPLSTVIVCQPLQVSWSGGTPPYFLTIIPGGQISALPLKSFDPTDAAFVTWTVDIAVGTAITFSLKDNTGDTAFSDQVTVLAGSDSSCVNSSSSVSGGAGSGASSTTPSTTNSGPSQSQSTSRAPSTSASGTAANNSAGSKFQGEWLLAGLLTFLLYIPL